MALLDIPPLTDEVLAEVAGTLFVELDKMAVADAEINSSGSVVSTWIHVV